MQIMLMWCVYEWPNEMVNFGKFWYVPIMEFGKNLARKGMECIKVVNHMFLVLKHIGMVFK